MYGRDYVPGRDSFFALLRRKGQMLPKPNPRHTTNSNHRYHKWKNLIKGFVPTATNRLWVADITYIPIATGDVCYLHLITDAYSRKAVGWALADTVNVTKMCLVKSGKVIPPCGRNHCGPVQGEMGHRDILPQPETELPHQEFCGNITQCGGNTGMDSTHHDAAPCLSETESCLQMALLLPHFIIKAEHLYENEPVDMAQQSFHATAGRGNLHIGGYHQLKWRAKTSIPPELISLSVILCKFILDTIGFWMDFSIADKFGINAIKDTYKRAFKSGKIITSISQSLLWFLTTRYGNGMRKTMLLHVSMMLFGKKQTFGHWRI